MSKNVVICGYGWLGRYLAASLSPSTSISATTRSSEKLKTLKRDGIQGIRFSLGDDSHDLLQALKGATLVLNIPPGRRNTQLDDFTQQMKTLVDDAKEVGVAQVIFISTTSVYGDDTTREIKETSSVMPETASAKAHVDIERHIAANIENYQILRLAGLVGPDRHPVNSLSGKSLSAGNKQVNLVHIEDVVAAIVNVIEGACTNTTLHLCSNTHPKRGEYYHDAAIAKQLPPPIFSDTEKPPTGKTINATYSWKALGVVPRFADPNAMY